MPNIEILIGSISEVFTNTQNDQQAYFSTMDLKYAYNQLQLHNDKAVVLTSFVENPQTPIDFKRDFTVLQICQLNFKKQWTAHLQVFKAPIASLRKLLLLAQNQNPLTLIMSLIILKN